MRIIRKVLAGLGIFILLLLIAAILIPILFKGKILEIAKTEINKQLNADVDFKDLDLSIFRHFPTLTVNIQDAYVANRAPFAGDTLIAAKNIEISLDIMKAIKGVYDVKGIYLVNPRIEALVNEQGQANWDITKPDTSATPATEEQKPFHLQLKKYSIEDGYIHYKDEQSHTEATVAGLDHNGSGDFSSDLFTLATNTEIEALSFSYGNISYLNKTKTSIDLDLEVDNKNSKYSFKTEQIQLNGLKLSVEGNVQIPDSVRTLMDIRFKTPSNDFKDILSLIPAVYAHDFDKVKTSGKATLDGFIKGTYSNTQMPAYTFNVVVENGMFKYPDLPQAVNDIQVKLKAENPDGVTDHTVINLERGHLAFGSEPFDFRMLLKTPVSNPWIDATGKGKIDLAKMQQFIKLDEGTKLRGIINADVSVKGYIAAAQKGNYSELDAKGNIGITDLFYAAKDYPDGVTLHKLALNFNPKNVTVSELRGQYLQTNFNGNGTVDNLLGYYLSNESLSGNFTVDADKMDLNKWMGSTNASGTAPATTSNNTPTTSNPPTTSSGPFIVPANLNILVNAGVGQVRYDNLDMTAVKASMEIKDQTVYLKNLSANALKGTIAISGAYSTKTDKKSPDINFGYRVQQVDIQQTFATFNTVQQLMPAAKFLSGTINSELMLSGKLDKDMKPVMSSLSGDGNVLLLQGLLSKFAVVDQLADKLNIGALKNVSMKDVKTWFDFKDGRINVQPFKFKVAGIDLEAGGSHGIDQTLKYALNMAVPRSLMGSQGNQFINNLAGQANNKGVPIKVGDVVNLAVNVGGTLTKPTFATNLKEVAGNVVNDVKQQIEAEAKARIDSAKNATRDTLKSVKNDIVNNAKKELTNQLTGNKDSTNANIQNTGKQVEEKAKGLINNFFNKKK